MPIAKPDTATVRYTIAVIGLGKIGLPLAVQYAQQGQRVIGCDINAQVVESLNQGRAHIQEETELAELLPFLVEQGLFSATTETSNAVEQANVVVVIVPVSIDDDHQVDFQQLDSATAAIGTGLQPDTLVIYETTVPVGTTALRLLPVLEERSQLHAGTDFHLAYSPERVSSGSIFRDLRRYPKVIGGIDQASTIKAITFYQTVLGAETIAMDSTHEAEYVKLIETTYRDVNIALANEYARYADAHGLNGLAAIAAANTQPYSHIHQPGVGVGGHCIPVYPYFLMANPYDRLTPEQDNQKFILPAWARQINDTMAEYAVQRIEEVMGSLCEQTVLILGVAYRGDVRETAWTCAKRLQQALISRGAQVYVEDPYFSVNELEAKGYQAFPPHELNGKIRAIILQSAHQIYQNFDFSQFQGCQVVLDGRYALQREAIESLGMSYLTIGGDGHQIASSPITSMETTSSKRAFSEHNSLDKSCQQKGSQTLLAEQFSKSALLQKRLGLSERMN